MLELIAFFGDSPKDVYLIFVYTEAWRKTISNVLNCLSDPYPHMNTYLKDEHRRAFRSDKGVVAGVVYQPFMAQRLKAATF